MSKSELFTIGEFSNITGVGIHSLRYYDEIGALKPAYVDPDNNYRYYGLSQLLRIPAINICLDAGINLASFDRFTESGSVDYDRLLSDSRRSLEAKIDSIILKLKDLEMTEILLETCKLLRETGEAEVALPALKLWTIPFKDDPGAVSASDILRILSADSKKHGCIITTSFYGICRIKSGEGVRTFAFSQILSCEESHEKNDHIMTVDEGLYRFRMIDGCSLDKAQKAFGDMPEGISSNTDLLMSAFLINNTPDSYCYCASVRCAH